MDAPNILELLLDLLFLLSTLRLALLWEDLLRKLRLFRAEILERVLLDLLSSCEDDMLWSMSALLLGSGCPRGCGLASSVLVLLRLFLFFLLLFLSGLCDLVLADLLTGLLLCFLVGLLLDLLLVFEFEDLEDE